MDRKEATRRFIELHRSDPFGQSAEVKLLMPYVDWEEVEHVLGTTVQKSEEFTLKPRNRIISPDDKT